YPRPHDDPRGYGHERHHQGGRREAEYQRVLQRGQGTGGVRQLPIVVEGHAGQCVLGWWRVELQQRGVQQHQQWRDHGQQEVQHDDDAGYRAPLAQFHWAGTESLAGDGLEVLAGTAREVGYHHPGNRDDQQADRKGTGRGQVWWIITKHEVDP